MAIMKLTAANERIKESFYSRCKGRKHVCNVCAQLEKIS